MNEEYKLPRDADYGSNVAANNGSISTINWLILPYKGEQGQKIIKSVKNYIKRLLPENYATFDIKDQTNLECKHDLGYLAEYAENTCSETYLRETVGALNERIMKDDAKVNKSHMLRHTFKSVQAWVSQTF